MSQVVQVGRISNTPDKTCPFLNSAQTQQLFYNYLFIAKTWRTVTVINVLLARWSNVTSDRICYTDCKCTCRTKSSGLHRSCRSGSYRCSFPPNCRNTAEPRAVTRPSTSASLLLCPSTMITECHLGEKGTLSTSIMEMFPFPYSCI